jgi:NAD(P)-dependent dehydrogenase (short-subunit alcohol dehydrogenase family)
VQGLDDTTVVVAGAATGIGAATAARLAAEGARVVVGDRNVAGAEHTAGVIREQGGEALAVGFDIGDEASVDALFTRAEEVYGAVDRVHANAAAFPPRKLGGDTDLLDIDLGVFDFTVQVNLRGHILVTRRALPNLIARQGAIVYTSSAAAFTASDSRPAYVIAKNGLHGLVRHVAARWGRDGVRANAIAPGFVLTELMKGVDSDGTLAQLALDKSCSPRVGRPEDIAGAVAFLMSDDAEWINGQVISVDGGMVLR